MKRLAEVLKGKESIDQSTANSKQFSNPPIIDYQRKGYEKGSQDGDEAALKRKFEYTKRKF